LAKFAILPTSKPLRSQVVKHGRPKQVLNGKILGDLAANYDLVIIGSTASDEFYQYLYNALPLNYRSKFKLYGRSFFTSMEAPEEETETTDQRTLGWMRILQENHINFETVRKTMGTDLMPRMEQFTWERMGDFIIDGRVIVLRESDLMH
jgi:hypothetical protein